MVNIIEILETFSNDEKTIDYLLEKNIIENSKKCWKCKGYMKIEKHLRLFRCSKRTCRKTVSIFKHTFFSNCKFGLNKCMIFCYLYLLKLPVLGLKDALDLSSKTICEWSHFIRQLLGSNVEEIEMQIGGPGIIVEIDETKLGKRKYNKGHRVEGVWVVVGIERTKEKKMFAVEVENRNKKLLKIFLKNMFWTVL